jgi:hypothetical protein
LNIGGELAPARLIMMNVYGVIVLDEVVTASGTTNTLDMMHLAEGIYFLTIYADTQLRTFRIVKM